MNRIRILGPDDQAALEAFVLPRIETSMFLLGNSRAVGLVDRGELLQGTYAAAFEDGAIVGVVAHFWSGNLVVNAPQGVDALWRAAAAASGRAIKGVIGPAAQAGQVLAELGARDVQLDKAENLYSLALAELILPPALTAGLVHVRKAQLRDVDLLAGWGADFDVESMNDEHTPALVESNRQQVEHQIGTGDLWVAEKDGVPVAMTAFNTRTREAVQVGGVFTPHDLRGRGYARAAVASSLIDARAGGADVAILFTGQDNVAAQRAYVALGFRQVGDYRIILLKS